MYETEVSYSSRAVEMTAVKSEHHGEVSEAKAKQMDIKEYLLVMLNAGCFLFLASVLFVTVMLFIT